MSRGPFTPIYDTESISVTTTSASATLGFQSDQVVLTNAGSTLCFVIVGSGAQTALTSHLPILPGASVVITKPLAALTVAAITAAGTTTLYATPGIGE